MVVSFLLLLLSLVQLFLLTAGCSKKTTTSKSSTRKVKEKPKGKKQSSTSSKRRPVKKQPADEQKDAEPKDSSLKEDIPMAPTQVSTPVEKGTTETNDPTFELSTRITVEQQNNEEAGDKSQVATQPTQSVQNSVAAEKAVEQTQEDEIKGGAATQSKTKNTSKKSQKL